MATFFLDLHHEVLCLFTGVTRDLNRLVTSLANPHKEQVFGLLELWLEALRAKLCQVSTDRYSLAEGKPPRQVIAIFDGDAIAGTVFDGSHEVLRVEESSVGIRFIRCSSNLTKVFDLAQFRHSFLGFPQNQTLSIM